MISSPLLRRVLVRVPGWSGTHRVKRPGLELQVIFLLLPPRAGT